MSEVIITVRGEHTTEVSPERATVSLSVSADGPQHAEVVERALALAAPVRESIEQRNRSGSILEWNSKRLDVRGERPWNADGERLAPVYRATVDFTATFGDTSELSLWATEISSWPGVEIGHTDWWLTPETTATVEQEVAAEAVRVAVARAQAYARALGLDTVTPLEVADRGLISTGPGPAPKSSRFAELAMQADAVGMQFQGEDITVSATVEARFRAS